MNSRLDGIGSTDNEMPADYMSTVPSIYRGSVVCGCEKDCCMIKDDGDLIAGTKGELVKCTSCRKLIHIHFVARVPNEQFEEHWECGCKVLVRDLARSVWQSLLFLSFIETCFS